MARGVMEKAGRTGVYVSKPETPSSTAILLIHEWWGLDDNMKSLADHFALLGWNAVAVDLFEGRTTADEKEAAALMEADDAAKSLQKLKETLTWLRTGPLKAQKVGTIGWCFGGGYSLQCALQFPEMVDGSVIYYGKVETDSKKLKDCKVPLLGIFAKRDNWITLNTVLKFEQASVLAGVPLENHIYDADHAFANPKNAKHNPEMTKDAMEKVTQFFRKVLA